MPLDEAFIAVLVQWRDVPPVLGDKVLEPSVAARLHASCGGRMGELFLMLRRLALLLTEGADGPRTRHP